MDTWHLALYAFASFLALKSLVSLMSRHKREFLNELVAQEQQRPQTATAGSLSAEIADSMERDEVAAA